MGDSEDDTIIEEPAETSKQQRKKQSPRPPRMETEVVTLHRELKELQMLSQKMELLKQIEECRDKIARHQTGNASIGSNASQQSQSGSPVRSSASVNGDNYTYNIQPGTSIFQPVGDSFSLNQPDTAFAGTNPTTSDIHAVNDLLALLSSATNDTYVTKTSRQNNARLVHNYIWEDPLLIHDKDEILTISRNEVRLNRRLDKEYFKIEQWGYGEARILHEMIEQKDIDPQGITYYLEYTKSINRLFSRYLKGNVMLFDREYIELQFKEKFRWGTPKSNILDFQLIPKQNSLTAQILQGQISSGPRKNELNGRQHRKGPFNPEGIEICCKFNSNNCDFPHCKLTHCCSLCY